METDLLSQEVSVNTEASSNQVPNLDGLQLLIVEDEADIKELFRTIFETFGAKVVAVATAKAATEAIVNYQPDIIVSDVSLPDEDGCSMLQKLKTRMAGEGKKILAIAVTGHVQESDRIRVLSSGFDTYFHKPIDIYSLLREVANLAKQK